MSHLLLETVEAIGFGGAKRIGRYGKSKGVSALDKVGLREDDFLGRPDAGRECCNFAQAGVRYPSLSVGAADQEHSRQRR